MNCLIRLITFDVNKTMIRVRGSPGIQYANIAKDYGIDIDPETLNNAFLGAYKYENTVHPNFGQPQGLSDYQWWSNVVHRSFTDAGIHGKDQEILGGIADHLYQHFLTAKGWEVLPHTVQTLTTLRERNYQLGVISNFDTRLKTVLAALRLDQYFDFIVTSVEAGACKPHPQPFQLALKYAGAACPSPSHALHVGDSYEKDYCGALNHGWKACLISDQQDTDLRVDPQYVIKNLPGLITCLESLEKDTSLLSCSESYLDSAYVDGLEDTMPGLSEQPSSENHPSRDGTNLGAVVVQGNQQCKDRVEGDIELENAVTEDSAGKDENVILSQKSDGSFNLEISAKTRSKVCGIEDSGAQKTNVTKEEKLEAGEERGGPEVIERYEKWLPYGKWVLTRKEHLNKARCPTCKTPISKGDLHIAVKTNWVLKKETPVLIERVYRYCLKRRCTQFPPTGSNMAGLNGFKSKAVVYIDPLIKLSDEQERNIDDLGFKMEEFPVHIGLKVMERNKHLEEKYQQKLNSYFELKTKYSKKKT